MSDNKNLEYDLPTSAYINFDAVALKDFMIERLNSNSTFTDQIYEGSNLSSIIEILAFYTHVLLFYSNQNSSEALIDQTTIYENANRIVKLLGYKPSGKQTSLCSVDCTASASLDIGSYILRKYSYFLVDNIQYTVIDNLSFEKTTTTDEVISSIGDNLVLYQGTVQEYPTYTALGDSFETFPVVVDNIVDKNDDRFIAHGTISVYVKEANDSTWYEYKEYDSLYFTNSTIRGYELRLNENGHYEVKFGNGTFSKKLSEGDQVKVFYVLSDNQKGIISKNAINGNKIFLYSNPTFSEIYSDITPSNSSTVINTATGSKLTFRNSLNSTPIYDAESIEDIKSNVPKLLGTQYRLVRTEDYDALIKKSLPNVIESLKIIDNETYINEYIQYYYDICVDPNKVNRVIINNVNFADSCDFNNINIFAVPIFDITGDGDYPPFLSNSLKNLIIDLTKDKKMIGHEVVPRDPVYVAFDLGISNGSANVSIRDNTKLVVTREKDNRISKSSLKERVYDAIITFFKSQNNELGGEIDITGLTNDIISIEGVKSIKTQNTVDNITFNGISFIAWNPLYEDEDSELINQNTQLPFYKFPYFYSVASLINKIEVIDA